MVIPSIILIDVTNPMIFLWVTYSNGWRSLAPRDRQPWCSSLAWSSSSCRWPDPSSWRLEIAERWGKIWQFLGTMIDDQETRVFLPFNLEHFGENPIFWRLDPITSQLYHHLSWWTFHSQCLRVKSPSISINSSHKPHVSAFFQHFSSISPGELPFSPAF